jgi:hypothetical protein
MALTNQGTRVSIPSQLIPSTFVAPAVTTFSDEEYVRTMTLNVLKATVDEADKAATLLAIINNATIGIAKQVDDIMAADYIATNTVDYWIDFKTLRSNIAVSKDTDFLSNAAVNYVVTVDVYIKTA